MTSRGTDALAAMAAASTSPVIIRARTNAPKARRFSSLSPATAWPIQSVRVSGSASRRDRWSAAEPGGAGGISTSGVVPRASASFSSVRR